MSKVDWVELELQYVHRPKMSYGKLAKIYGLAKSTVTRHAVKHDWYRRRRDFIHRRTKAIREKKLHDTVEAEERHLRSIKMAIDIMHTEIKRLAIKITEGDSLTLKETYAMSRLSGSMIQMIMLERKILNLPTKPVTFNNQKEMHEYLVSIGIAAPSDEDFYKKARKAHHDGELLEDHLKRLKTYMGDWGADLE